MPRILWIIVAALLAFWLIGAVLDLAGSVIHFVLVAAIVVAAFAFLRRKV